MENDEEAREVGISTQPISNSGDTGGNALGSLIATNDLNAIDLTENPQHEHCNESSCDLTIKNIDNNPNSNPCQFAGHHYHYIEYPGIYYQKRNSQNANGAMPQSPNSNMYHYCVCSCSSGGQMQMQMSSDSRLQQEQQQQQQQQQKQQQQQQESRLAVSAIVHHQSGDVECNLRAKSQQSLLSHSYQMLNIPLEKKSDSICHSKLNMDCNVEDNCTTETASPGQQQCHRINRKCKKISNSLTDAVLATADEITVSESDNNGSLTKRKTMRESRVQKKINSWYAKNYNCNHIEIYSDGDEGDNNHRNDIVVGHDSLTNILDQRPPLPPRPQPITSTIQSSNNTFGGHRPGSQSIKKYVIWCLVCGGFSCLLGALFLGVYFLLHSYTITVGNFETVPTFVPATLLILTGLCIMSLARRRNRYSYLIKLSGACGLISALTCALVTVTTTVLHMSRLQALRECEYAQKTRTCTCYSDMIESQVDRVDKEGVRLVFDSLSDCGVVHGSLYSCLRAIFGLSVAGVLIAVFSCMLVYQLLSHERKKMYWEQLELRCRSLYSSHHQQHHQQQGPSAHSIAALAGINSRNAPICRCCEQCHAHRQLQLQTASYPWVDDSGEPRFWAGQPPGNFYSPNPGGEESHMHAPTNPSNRSRISSGWSWPRMPWQRNSTESGNRFRQIPSSPDSQYGFSSTNASLGLAVNNAAVPSTSEEEATAAAVAAVAAATATQRAAQAFNIVTGGGALPYGIWGPPPPYSDPNSPARRGYYQYMQPSNSLCTTNQIGDNNGVCSSDDVMQQRPLSAGALNALAASSTPNVGSCVNQRAFDHLSQRLCQTDQLQRIYKSKENSVETSLNNDYGNTCSESDVECSATRLGDRFANTLPTRKLKKRLIDGSSSIAKCVGTNTRHQLASHRINVQRVFPNSSNSTSENDADANCNSRPLNRNRYGKSGNGNGKDTRVSGCPTETGNNNRIAQNMTISEHLLTQCNDNLDHNTCTNNCGGVNDSVSGSVAPGVPTNCDGPYEDPTESEIYFADVSSCCNMSMKNDNCYEDSTRNMHHHLHQQQRHQNSVHGTNHSSQRSISKQNQDHSHSHLHPHQPIHSNYHHQRSNRSQSNNSSSGSCCAPKEDHHTQNFGQRESSVRGRQHVHVQSRQGEAYNKELSIVPSKMTIGNNGNMNNDIASAAKEDGKIENNIPKDTSLHSMCSIESEAKTECTDLSPLTPSSNKNLSETIFQQCNNNSNSKSSSIPQSQSANGFSNFIASFPYSSESKFHEAHRRFTKHMHDNLRSPTVTETQESHYEIINDDGIVNKNNKVSSMRNTSTLSSSHQLKPKTLNSNCNNYSKNSMSHANHGRSTKGKEYSDASWPTSDASSSSHNRQRL